MSFKNEIFFDLRYDFAQKDDIFLTFQNDNFRACFFKLNINFQNQDFY